MTSAKSFFKDIILNVLGMIGLSCYILVDTMVIANALGSDGLAALNIALPLYNLVSGAGLMIGMGAATRFSLSKSKTVFTNAFVLMICVSFMLLVLGITSADSMAYLLGARGKVLDMSAAYMRIILSFSPLFMLNNLVICFVRNDGGAHLSMAGMLLGSLSNVVLDLVFVNVFGWGMEGAAAATAIAPVISLLVMSVHFFKKNNTFGFVKAKLSARENADIARLGISSFVTELSGGIIMALYNFLILARMGNTGVAAYGIVANAALVVIAVFTGISQGMQPSVSRAFGKGEKLSVKRYLVWGLLVSTVFAAAVYGGCFMFSDQIVSVFNKDADTVLAECAKTGLRIYFTSFLLASVNMVVSMFFSAAGYGGKGFLISVLRGFAAVIPCALIFDAVLGMTGIWISVTAAEAVTLFVSVVMIFRFFRKSA